MEERLKGPKDVAYAWRWLDQLGQKFIEQPELKKKLSKEQNTEPIAVEVTSYWLVD